MTRRAVAVTFAAIADGCSAGSKVDRRERSASDVSGPGHRRSIESCGFSSIHQARLKVWRQRGGQGRGGPVGRAPQEAGAGRSPAMSRKPGGLSSTLLSAS